MLKSWVNLKQTGQFILRNSIALDAEGNSTLRIAVTAEFQVFDGEGKFLRQITIDVPFDHMLARQSGTSANSRTRQGLRFTLAICITPPPDQVMYSSDAYPGGYTSFP